MSAVFSDEEEAEEDEPRLNSFAKRLTKYQRSPTKNKSRGRSLYASQDHHCLLSLC